MTRTHVAEPVTPEQRDFLSTLKRLEDAGLPAKRSALGLADRNADRVRQSCRVAGWVRWGGVPARWRLNQSGRDVLEGAPT
jgi:hypothetical protein